MKDVTDRKTSGRNILWAISNAAAANGDYELFLIDYSLGVVSETGVDVCRYVRQSDWLIRYFISVPFTLFYSWGKFSYRFKKFSFIYRFT